MPSLLKLQQTFQQAILQSAHDEVLSHIKPNHLLSQQTQFNLYKNSITGNLKKALSKIYPVCSQLVGEDFFLAMAGQYISQTPSRTRDLNLYGNDFAEFIADFEPAQSLTYLPDVARLEWAWHRVFSAADTVPFDFQKLAECYAAGTENIFFALPPQSTLLTSPYPIDQIWEANHKSHSSDTTITLLDNSVYYFLIWRNGFEMCIDSLTPLQWQILCWIQQCFTLNAICEKAEGLFPDAAITEILPELVNAGWIASFSL